MPSAETHGPTLDLTLTIPATSDHIRFARLLGSAAAARLGFDYDAIEDLRIAVSELCTAVAEACRGDGTLTLTYCADGADGLRVDGSATFTNKSGNPVVERDELIGDILDAVADEHQLDLAPAGGSFMLRMSPTRSPES